MKSSALMSQCGRFRYVLTREWDDYLPTVAFVMLNPSTADAVTDDPTIRKCIGFATRLGFGGLAVVNLYAYRATKPADLRAAGWPVGPENDHFIAGVCRESSMVICAWGSNAARNTRPGAVLEIIRAAGKPPMALRVSRGVPHHPLMLPYTCVPEEIPR